MTSLLTAYLLVLLLPLFVASWRVSVTGLALQGVLMAWMVIHEKPPWTADVVVTLVDLAVVRGVIAPVGLARVLHAQHRAPRMDVIPPNMLSWAVAVALVTLAFRCASWLEPQPGTEHLHVAVAVAALLLALFVLSTQNGVFSQALGVLRLENAIALFELGRSAHVSLGMQIGEGLVFVATVFTLVFYVGHIQPAIDPHRGPSL